MKTKTLSAIVVAAAALVPGVVVAQTTAIPFGSYTGGSSFATSLTGGLTYLNGLLTLTVRNDGPGVFAAIGIVKAPSSGVNPGTAPTGWTWNTTSQLGGAGLPQTTWAWIAPQPPSQHGLQVGGGFQTFTFDIGTSVNYSQMGFAVHAIDGPGGCSTKFGVWNGGRATNDAVANGGSYDATCVDVPEPESMPLLMTGLTGLAFIASRRRNGLLDANGDEV